MGYSRLRYDLQGRARYTAYYWDLCGHARSAGTFIRKRDANRAWRKTEAKIADGKFVNVADGRQRFDRYVTAIWLPNHVMELNTRQGYTHIIRKYLLAAFGTMRMNEILPAHIRDFLRHRGKYGASAHTLARCKTVLSAIFTTALNDQVIHLHPCTGVKTPTAPKRPLRILAPDEFSVLLQQLPGPQWRLLAELALETGVRWGELAELRASDFNPSTRQLTISRTVVELHPPQDGVRFVVKHYPKNVEYRHLTLSRALAQSLTEHIDHRRIAPDDLLFPYPHGRAEFAPEDTDSVDSVGQAGGGHGTISHYTSRGCSCPTCRGACAHYRARRRALGKDRPPVGKRRDTDGHLPRNWFRLEIWNPTQTKAGITHRVRMHDLRHTNASWMLAGGADLETVRERLGHRSLRATERYLNPRELHQMREKSQVAC
jgi:site-specific recombinase XerD